MTTFSCAFVLEQRKSVNANLTYWLHICMYHGRLMAMEVRKPLSYTFNLCSYCGEANMA